MCQLDFNNAFVKKPTTNETIKAIGKLSPAKNNGVKSVVGICNIVQIPIAVDIRGAFQIAALAKGDVI